MASGSVASPPSSMTRSCMVSLIVESPSMTMYMPDKHRRAVAESSRGTCTSGMAKPSSSGPFWQENVLAKPLKYPEWPLSAHHFLPAPLAIPLTPIVLCSSPQVSLGDDTPAAHAFKAQCMSSQVSLALSGWNGRVMIRIGQLIQVIWMKCSVFNDCTPRERKL